MNGAALHPLDAWIATRPLGAGGQGDAWLVRHRAMTAVGVIKVLRTDDATLRTLAREARALARVHSPHIVKLWDLGRWSPDAGLPPLPALLMEYIEGAPVDPATEGRCLTWTIALLRGLLHGLAACHARGVVHGDVKPANILLRPGSHPSPVLVDFGLSRDAMSAPTRAGTPGFIAPEVIRFPDLGPVSGAADLYAVGCIAVRALTGQALFATEDNRALLHAHATRPPEVGDLRGDAPPELRAWLESLVATHPYDRFPSAAHAARALEALVDQRMPTVATHLQGTHTTPTPTSMSIDSVDAILWDSSRYTQDASLPLRPSTDSNVTGATGRDLVPLTRPATYIHRYVYDDLPLAEAPDHLHPSFQVGPNRAPRPFDLTGAPRRRPPPGAGRGIARLLEPPLVGREAHTTRLWRALHTTERERSPTLALIHGPSGVGATRLAMWCTETTLRGGHGGTLTAELGDDANSDIGRGVLRALLATEQGSDRPTTLHRHGIRDAALLASLLRDDLLHNSALDTTSLAAAAVCEIASRRRCVVTLDDIQRAEDLAVWFRILRAYPHPLRLLVVATWRTDERALDERACATWLPNVQLLECQRLDADAFTELVSQVIDLRHTDIEALFEYTGGLPAFALELLRDETATAWTERDTFTLQLHATTPRSTESPRARHWAARVDATFAAQNATFRTIAALAALLEDVVKTSVLERAAMRAHATVARENEAHLAAEVAATEVTATLAMLHTLGWMEHVGVTHWRWSHSWVQDAIRDHSVDANTRRQFAAELAASLLEAAAPILEASDGDDITDVPPTDQQTVEAATQVARLTALSGQPREAARAYIRAASAWLRHARTHRLHVCATLAIASLDACCAPASDPLRGVARHLVAAALHSARRMDEAHAQLRDLSVDARRFGWRILEGRVQRQLAAVAWSAGDRANALAAVAHAVQLTAANGDTAGEIDAFIERIWIRCGVGDFAAALEDVAHARVMLGRAPCPTRDLMLQQRSARLYRQMGDVQSAAECHRRVLEMVQLDENPLAVANAMNGRAECLRELGNHDEAIHWYEHALTAYQRSGSGQIVYAMLNLALVCIERELHDQASQHVHDALRVLEAGGDANDLACARLIHICARAGAGAWEDVAKHADATLRFFRDGDFVDTDCARCAERIAVAAARASRAQDPPDPIPWFEAAASQWRRLGRCDDLARVEQRIDALTNASACASGALAPSTTPVAEPAT